MNEVLGTHGLLDAYAFVRDRCRAIRNDLTLQNYRGPEAIDLHERIARYHILCSHVLCDVEGVSLQQEHEQLRKSNFLKLSHFEALQSLMEYYQEMAEAGIQMPNEPEFQAYYILTHAYSNETVSRAEELATHVFFDPRVQSALSLQSMMARTNEEYIQGRASENGSLNFYSAVFRELSKTTTSYLMACCLHMDFVDIRRGALKAMQKAYYCFPDNNRTVWPIEELVSLLGFDDESDVLETLEYYEIPHENRDGEWVALIGRTGSENTDGKLQMTKGLFKGMIFKMLLKTEGQRKSLPPRKSLRLVEAKRKGISDVDVIQARHVASMPVLPFGSRKPFREGIEGVNPRQSMPSITPAKPIFAPSPASSFISVMTPQPSIGFGGSAFGSSPLKTPSFQQPLPVSTLKQSMEINAKTTSDLIPPMPAQKPLDARLVIPDPAIAEYTQNLIQEHIQTYIRQDPLLASLLFSKEQLINSLCAEASVSIIDELTSEYVWGRLRAAKEIALFRSCVKDIVNDLVAATVHEEISLIAVRAIQEFEAVETRIRRYEQFGWDRWRFVMLRLQARLEKKQQEAVLTFLNLKGSSLGPFNVATPHKRKSPSKVRKASEREQSRMIARVHFFFCLIR